MKIIVDENMQDIDFIKEYTDLPLLVRTDTLQYLDPRDVIADYKFPDFSKSYSGRVQSLKPEQIERLGGMMVWDLSKKQAVPLHREQVGWHFKESGIDPALTGTYPGEAAQWPRSRRDADLPDVSSAPPGLRPGYLPSDHAVRRKTCWSVGRGIRARSSPPRFITAKASVTISIMTEMGRAAAMVMTVTGQHRQVRHRAAIPGPATTRPASGTRRPGPAPASRCTPVRIRSI